jgi:hypothetical protein
VFVVPPLPGREMCDVCRTSPTARLYACRNFIVPRMKHTVFQHESIGAWAACDRCAVLIDAGHWSQLTDRAARRFMKKYGVPKGESREVREQLAEFHQLVREHMI